MRMAAGALTGLPDMCYIEPRPKSSRKALLI